MQAGAFRTAAEGQLASAGVAAGQAWRWCSRGGEAEEGGVEGAQSQQTGCQQPLEVLPHGFVGGSSRNGARSWSAAIDGRAPPQEGGVEGVSERARRERRAGASGRTPRDRGIGC